MDVPTIPGFEVLRVLGEGAQSTVFEARHDETPVALKVVRHERAGEDEKRRLFREASMLARLQHSNIVTVMAAGDASGVAYSAMELVPGETLAETLVARQRLSNSEVAAIGSSIAGALGALHGQGLLHRDVKPSNILMTDKGEAKLADLGLAITVETTEKGQAAVGSFAYAAPEQTGMLKRSVDGRADLYALGITLFECVAGSRPFEADDAGELIRLHATHPVPPLKQIREDVHPGLAAVITTLLHKDPDDRYQTTDALIADLGRLDELAKAGQSPSVGHLDDLATVSSFVGRAHEVQQLKSCWEQAAAHRGQVALVLGQPGVGKTRLVQEVLSSSVGPEVPVLRSKCTMGGAIPFAALRQSFDSLLQWIARAKPEARKHAEAHIRNAAGDNGPSLMAAMPKLGSLLGIEKGQLLSEGVGEVFFDVVAEFLAKLASEFSGMLFFVDDIQWLDGASRNVLGKLCARMDDVPVFLLAVARSNSEYTDAVALFGQAVGERLKIRINLQPLSDDDVAAMIRDFLGTGNLQAAGVDEITVRANGSPLAVGEFLRQMMDAGLLRPTWGTWRLDVEGLEKLNLPTDVLDLIAGRIEHLGEDAQEILRIAALIGSRFDAELLRHAAQNEEGVDEAIRRALSERLVEPVGKNLSFVHDRVQEALLQGVSAEHRADLHDAIAGTLVTLGYDDDEAKFALAEHTARGHFEKNITRAFDANLTAGLLAASSHANREACVLFERCETYCASGRVEATLEFRRTWGLSATRLQHSEVAVRQLGLALELTDDPTTRSLMRCEICEAHLCHMDLTSAYNEAELGLQELGRSMKGFMPLMILGGLASLVWALAITVTGIGYGTAKGKKRERYKTLSRLYSTIGAVCASESYNGQMLLATIKGLLLARRLGTSPEEAMSYGTLALVASTIPAEGLVKKWSRRCEAVAESLGDPVFQTKVQFYLLLARDWGSKDPAASAENTEILRNMIRERANYFDSFDFLGLLSWYTWQSNYRGRIRDAQWFVAQAGNRVSPSDTSHSADLMRTALVGSAVHAMSGNFEKSLSMMDWLTEPEQPYMFRLSVQHCCLLHYMLLGEWDRAVETLPDFRKKNIRFEASAPHRRWLYVGMFNCRVMIHERDRTFRSYVKAVLALFRASMTARLPAIECHFLLNKATWARVRGKFSKARRLLSEAETLSAKVDCPWVLAGVEHQRALMLRSEGYIESAQSHAGRGVEIATEAGITAVVRQIVSDFDIRKTPSSTTSMTRSMSVSTGRSTSDIQLERRFDALMSVSMAAAKVFRPGEVARVTLDEAVRLLGAERGAILLAPDEERPLQFHVGRTSERQDVAQLEGYSTTVVDTVRRERKPMVVTGSEDGELVDSESVVAFGLRSMIAAPLMYHDNLLGVIYLDNHLAKGIFTTDDVSILEAVGAQMAISLEAARIAEQESERKAMEKDLALTGAVQSLLMPRERDHVTERLDLAGFDRPAAISGGDWWWWQELNDHQLFALVADVTGHGAGPAMITAAASGSFRTLMHRGGIKGVEDLLTALNLVMAGICADAYRMTVGAILVDTQKDTIEWWSAGAPPIFVQRAGGDIETFVSPGTPVGTPTDLHLGYKSTSFAPGDLVLLFSDGLSELEKANGRELGFRGVKRLVQDVEQHGQDMAHFRDYIESSIDTLRGDRPQGDDITFVALRRRA